MIAETVIPNISNHRHPIPGLGVEETNGARLATGPELEVAAREPILGDELEEGSAVGSDDGEAEDEQVLAAVKIN